MNSCTNKDKNPKSLHIYYFFSYLSQMPIGRNCVAHYRELSRYCVFSHDEMVCNMAAKAESMDMDVAAIVQKEIIAMVQEEDELRAKIDKLVSGSDLKGLLLSLALIFVSAHVTFSARRCL